MIVVCFLSVDLSGFFYSSGRSSTVNTTTTGLTVGAMGLFQRMQSDEEGKDLKRPDLLDFEREIQIFKVIYFNSLVIYCKRLVVLILCPVRASAILLNFYVKYFPWGFLNFSSSLFLRTPFSG